MEKATQLATSSLKLPSGTDTVSISDTIRTADPSVLRAHVQQLNTLTARIEEFLSYQIHRLESMDGISATVSAGSPADLDRLIDEFEELRRSWEVERQVETERMRSDAEQLKRAWQQLEVEQRQLLTRQAAIRTVGANSMVSASAQPVVAATGAGGLYPSRSAGPRAVNSVPQHYNSNEVAAASAPSHNAQIQFQQLRREMQKHAQQRNKR
jgi:hypothetical protein